MPPANWFVIAGMAAVLVGTIIVAVLIVLMIVYLAVRSRLQALVALLTALAGLGSLLRSIASAVDLAASAAQGAGQFGVSAGSTLVSVGSTLDSVRVPTGQLQTRNLWDCGVPNPLHLGPVYVLTDVSLQMQSLLPQSQNLVDRAGKALTSTANKLGPPPSAPGTLSWELTEAARLLRQVAHLADAIHP